MTETDIQNEAEGRVAHQRMARRRRVIYVPENYVLALLSRGLWHNQYVRVPEPLGVPETARMVGVWTDYSRNAFALVVEDASFEETPEGLMLPEMRVEWSVVELATKPPSAELTDRQKNER